MPVILLREHVDPETKLYVAVISYFRKRTSTSQQRYGTTAKEYHPDVLAVQHCRGYLWDRHSNVVIDHVALQYLCPMQDTSNTLTRWAAAL